MNNKIHFSQLTKEQVTRMYAAAIHGCIEYAKSINMSGLSDQPSHNIYNAIENAIFNEWEKAKKIISNNND